MTRGCKTDFLSADQVSQSSPRSCGSGRSIPTNRRSSVASSVLRQFPSTARTRAPDFRRGGRILREEDAPRKPCLDLLRQFHLLLQPSAIRIRPQAAGDSQRRRRRWHPRCRQVVQAAHRLPNRNPRLASSSDSSGGHWATLGLLPAVNRNRLSGRRNHRSRLSHDLVEELCGPVGSGLDVKELDLARTAAAPGQELSPWTSGPRQCPSNTGRRGGQPRPSASRMTRPRRWTIRRWLRLAATMMPIELLERSMPSSSGLGVARIAKCRSRKSSMRLAGVTLAMPAEDQGLDPWSCTALGTPSRSWSR